MEPKPRGQIETEPHILEGNLVITQYTQTRVEYRGSTFSVYKVHEGKLLDIFHTSYFDPYFYQDLNEIIPEKLIKMGVRDVHALSWDQMREFGLEVTPLSLDGKPTGYETSEDEEWQQLIPIEEGSHLSDVLVEHGIRINY